jgi:hypothetical protein
MEKRRAAQAAIRSRAAIVVNSSASNDKELPEALSKVGDRMLQLRECDTVVRLEERTDGWIFGARMKRYDVDHPSKRDIRVRPASPAPGDKLRAISPRRITYNSDIDERDLGWYFEESADPILPSSLTLIVLIDALGGIFRAEGALESIMEKGLAQRDKLREPFVDEVLERVESVDAQESEQALLELMQVMPLFRSHSRVQDMIEAITDRTKQLVDHETTLKELAGRLMDAENEARSNFQRAWEKICEGATDVHLLLRKTLQCANKFACKPTTSLMTLPQVMSCASLEGPPLLRAMQEIVENAKGTFSLPPPVGKVRKGSTLLDKDLISCLKAKDRIQEKVDSDYGGDYSRICDVVRASGIFKTPSQLADALQQMQSRNGKLQIVRCKDRLNNPVNGYRDLLLNVRLSGRRDEAIVGELQFHFATIIAIKSTAHVSYAMKRGLSLELDAVVNPDEEEVES